MGRFRYAWHLIALYAASLLPGCAAIPHYIHDVDIDSDKKPELIEQTKNNNGTFNSTMYTSMGERIPLGETDVECGEFFLEDRNLDDCSDIVCIGKWPANDKIFVSYSDLKTGKFFSFKEID